MEAAVPELAACFVHGPWRDGEDVADGNDLVGVVEICRCRRRAQSPSASRIYAGHFIQAVARAELVSIAEAVIDFTEEIRTMNGIGIDSGGDLRTWVADCEQSCVDRGYIGGRNRDQTGLVQQLLFEIRKEERSVVNNGSAETSAML